MVHQRDLRLRAIRQLYAGSESGGYLVDYLVRRHNICNRRYSRFHRSLERRRRPVLWLARLQERSQHRRRRGGNTTYRSSTQPAFSPREASPREALKAQRLRPLGCRHSAHLGIDILDSWFSNSVVCYIDVLTIFRMDKHPCHLRFRQGKQWPSSGCLLDASDRRRRIYDQWVRSSIHFVPSSR